MGILFGAHLKKIKYADSLYVFYNRADMADGNIIWGAPKKK